MPDVLSPSLGSMLGASSTCSSVDNLNDITLSFSRVTVTTAEFRLYFDSLCVYCQIVYRIGEVGDWILHYAGECLQVRLFLFLRHLGDKYSRSV